MPIPSTMADLSTLASSNSPAGTEAIGNSLDNYLRSHAAIIRSTNALSSSTIAAASTTDVATSDAESVQITGAATITSLGTGYNGCRRELRFVGGACTLVHSASIVLPNATNMLVQSGDICAFRCVAAGQWILVSTAVVKFDGISGLSAFAKTLLDDPDAATARATLGAVAKVGDTMTGTLVNDHSGGSNNYQNSNRGGFGFAWFNLGDGNHGLFDATAATNAWNYLTSGGGVHTFRGAASFSGQVTATNAFESRRADSNWGVRLATAAAALRGGLWMRSDGVSLVNVNGPGGFQELFMNNNGNVTLTGGNIVVSAGNVTCSGSVTAGSLALSLGFTVTKFTVSNAAPGALGQGEVYFRY